MLCGFAADVAAVLCGCAADVAAVLAAMQRNVNPATRIVMWLEVGKRVATGRSLGHLTVEGVTALHRKARKPRFINVSSLFGSRPPGGGRWVG